MFHNCAGCRHVSGCSETTPARILEGYLCEHYLMGFYPRIAGNAEILKIIPGLLGAETIFSAGSSTIPNEEMEISQEAINDLLRRTWASCNSCPDNEDMLLHVLATTPDMPAQWRAELFLRHKDITDLSDRGARQQKIYDILLGYLTGQAPAPAPQPNQPNGFQNPMSEQTSPPWAQQAPAAAPVAPAPVAAEKTPKKRRTKAEMEAARAAEANQTATQNGVPTAMTFGQNAPAPAGFPTTPAFGQPSPAGAPAPAGFSAAPGGFPAPNFAPAPTPAPAQQPNTAPAFNNAPFGNGAPAAAPAFGGAPAQGFNLPAPFPGGNTAPAPSVFGQAPQPQPAAVPAPVPGTTPSGSGPIDLTAFTTELSTVSAQVGQLIASSGTAAQSVEILKNIDAGVGSLHQKLDVLTKGLEQIYHLAHATAVRVGAIQG